MAVVRARSSLFGDDGCSTSVRGPGPRRAPCPPWAVIRSPSTRPGHAALTTGRTDPPPSWPTPVRCRWWTTPSDATVAAFVLSHVVDPVRS